MELKRKMSNYKSMRDEKRDAREFCFIPSEYVTREMCYEYMKNDWRALKYVPERYRDREMYERAVMYNGEALEYVPETYVTREMCKDAMRTSGGCVYERFPKKYKEDEELREMCVRRWPMSIKIMEPQDKSLCELAVSLDVSAMRYVREENRSCEMMKSVLDRCDESFMDVGEYVTDEFRDRLYEFYRRMGYEKYGKIWVCVKECYESFPCQHSVVYDRDGRWEKYVSSDKIAEMMDDIRHEHFTKKKKNDDDAVLPETLRRRL